MYRTNELDELKKELRKARAELELAFSRAFEAEAAYAELHGLVGESFEWNAKNRFATYARLAFGFMDSKTKLVDKARARFFREAAMQVGEQTEAGLKLSRLASSLAEPSPAKSDS